MTISLYLTRPKAKGNTSIFARISFAGYQLKYYTPESINPKFWSKETKLVKQTDKFKEYPEFNQRLLDWKTDVANLYRKWINDHQGTIPNPDILKLLLDRELKKVVPEIEQVKTFLGFFKDIIEKTKSGERLQPVTGRPYSKATVQVYQNTWNRIEEFSTVYGRSVDFKTINIDFYTDFTSYLSKRLKLASNTIGKDVKTIKTILNEATERGINTNLQYRSRKFSVTTENTDAIYLTEEEIRKLEALDLSANKRLETVRDLFLIGCNTGLRFSDWASLRPEQIQDGFMEITQIKTNHPVVIPIHPTVKRILDKYNGHLPRTISNQKANEYLKELGKIVPKGETEPVLNAITSKTLTKGGSQVTVNKRKWEALCTHTARRSFATNEYLAGTPTLTIMAITGHKTEKAFLRYIKLTPKEHAKLMQLHWTQRNELKAV